MKGLVYPLPPSVTLSTQETYSKYEPENSENQLKQLLP